MKSANYLTSDVKNYVNRLEDSLNSYKEVKPDVAVQPTKQYLSDAQLTKNLNNKYNIGKLDYKKDMPIEIQKDYEAMWKGFQNGTLTNKTINEQRYEKNDISLENDPNPMDLNKVWKHGDSWIGISAGLSCIAKFTVPYGDITNMFNKCNSATNECFPLYQIAEPKYVSISDSINNVHEQFKLVRNGDNVNIFSMVLNYHFIYCYNPLTGCENYYYK